MTFTLHIYYGTTLFDARNTFSEQRNTFLVAQHFSGSPILVAVGYSLKWSDHWQVMSLNLGPELKVDEFTVISIFGQTGYNKLAEDCTGSTFQPLCHASAS